ncbi:MAG TPA: Ku protein [Hyphomicrobiaceae bacterium]|nr:Ku protein [Hyphomicrobiaceae bacterium]
MAPRPNWKGYLKLSLVSCPVALFPATTTSERISFRTLNRTTGNRLRRQLVDEHSGEVVEAEDQIKGYEIAKGEYIQVDDDELKSVQVESNHTIDIERFVRRADVDELYLDTPYYLTPTDRVGEEAFAVIRDAMRAEKMVGLARVVLFRRERIVMLEPRGKGIGAFTLHYANEVHQAANYFDEIPDLELPKQMLELASHIIEKMTGKFEPDQFEDRYENALIELIRSKQTGTPIKAQPVARQTNVINLMDALRRSVEGAGGKAEAGRAAEQAAERAPKKAASPKKAEKAEKATPKTRATPGKAKTRKAG